MLSITMTSNLFLCKILSIKHQIVVSGLLVVTTGMHQKLTLQGELQCTCNSCCSTCVYQHVCVLHEWQLQCSIDDNIDGK